MDFLTFKTFISTEALILFYYIGAVILPIGMWFLITWLLRKYEIIHIAHQQGKETFWKTLNQKQKRYLIIFFITSFLFLELFWRMLFEFLIAYMQIRDALLHSQMS